MKKIIFIICVSLFMQPVIAQNLNLKEVDLQLSKLYNDLKFSDWEAKDTLLPAFTNMLYTTLAKPESFSHSFDSISTKILRVTSPDNKIKIWSWDTYAGGSWHQNMTAVQFMSEDGKLGFRQLNSGEEMMMDGYTDVYINEIFEIEDKGELYYLTLGRGSHGSGNYHRLAQVFFVKGDEFVKCETCFEGETDLILEVWRGDVIELEFDPVVNTLSHTILVHDEMRDRYYATDKIQKWVFKNGSFIKTEKKED